MAADPSVTRNMRHRPSAGVILFFFFWRFMSQTPLTIFHSQLLDFFLPDKAIFIAVLHNALTTIVLLVLYIHFPDLLTSFPQWLHSQTPPSSSLFSSLAWPSRPSALPCSANTTPARIKAATTPPTSRGNTCARSACAITGT